MKQKFNVSGMNCSHCKDSVEKAVRKLTGIEKADVDLLSNSLVVEYNNEKVSDKDILSAVSDIGFIASIYDENTDNIISEKSERKCCKSK